MTCPHCNTGVKFQFQRIFLKSYTNDEAWAVDTDRCPECHKIVIFLSSGRPSFSNGVPAILVEVKESSLRAWPAGAVVFCPPEVPEDVSKDFLEASQVLPISAQASAALSRRCLQHILVKYGQAAGRDLIQQIENFITTKNPPSYIAKQLHAVRQIGNFAAHPQKDTVTGEILPVEPGEAEWNLEVLQSMFDFQFVKPAQQAKRIQEFNEKLKAAGKQPLPQ
jgi:hypothetical protein